MLITSGLGITNGEGELHKTGGNGAILLTSWSESGVCELKKEWSEITVALSDESEWRGNNDL